MFKNFKSELIALYDSRYILKSLVVKNLKGPYRNSFLGIGWHFITPVILLCVYFVAFNQIRISPIPDYWIYLSSGLFPFNYMVSNLIGGSNCIIGNSGMVKKMYFPRIILVLSQTISSFIVMLIGYAIILIVIVAAGHGIEISIVFLPILLGLTFLFVLGYVLIFSSITVYLRDIQYLLSSVSMVFFFMTPMFFMLDSIIGVFRMIVYLNPFTYFVECYHAIVYHQTFPDSFMAIMVFILPIISLIAGLIIFNRLKGGFAERL